MLVPLALAGALSLALLTGLFVFGTAASARADDTAQPSEAVSGSSAASPVEATPTAATPNSATPTAATLSAATPSAATPSAAAPTATPSDSPAPPTTSPIASPTITSPSPGDLVGSQVTVAGSAEPGSGIQVSSSTQSDPLCTLTAAADGSFSCSSSALPSGPNATLTVVQLVAGYDTQSTSVAVNVLTAPTLAAGSASGVSTGYGTVRGSAYPGATVTASGGAYTCQTTADGAGSWACNLGSGIPSGVLQVTAEQATGWSNGVSASSDVLALQIDSSAPAPPTITSPAPGASVAAAGATVAGTGENGALVTVFAGAYAACTVTVQGSSWSCTTAGVAAGSAQLSAIQQDVAGNVSDESAPFGVVFTASGGASASASPSAGATAPSTGAGSGSTSAGATAPGTSTPGSAGSSGSGGAGSAGNGSSAGGSSGAGGSGGSGAAGGSDGSGAGGTGGSAGDAPGSAPHDPGANTWAEATRFTSALQPVFASSPLVTWLLALAAALVAIALIAAPGRLLLAAVTSRRGPDVDARRHPRALSRAAHAATAKRAASTTLPGGTAQRTGTAQPTGTARPTGKAQPIGTAQPTGTTLPGGTAQPTGTAQSIGAARPIGSTRAGGRRDATSSRAGGREGTLAGGAAGHTTGRASGRGASRAGTTSPAAARTGRLTGRNRARNEFDRAPDLTVNPWLVAAAGVLLTAGIGMLSGPVDNQPSYLRLLLALALAFTALNAAGVLLPRLIARRWWGVASTVSFAPRFVLIATAVALGSRALDLQPALVFGLVLGLASAGTLSRTMQARFAALQLGCLIACGAVAWLGLVWLPDSTTLADATTLAGSAPAAALTLANEVLTITVIGGFAAAAVLALPFGRLPGRAVFEWSKAAWFAVALVAFTLLAAVLAPSFEHTGRQLALAQALLIMVVFAAVSVSVWVWQKFVAPALAE